MDDIEEQMQHVNFMSLATDRAAHRLADQYDQEVLGYLSGYKQSALHANAAAVNDQVNGTKADTTAGSDELLASMKLNKGAFGNITTTSAGAHSIPLAARLPGATALPTATCSPAMVVARMKRLLDQNQVDSAGRWLCVDPVFMELLADEDSRFLNADYGDSGALRNGLTLNNFHGFRVYTSSNLALLTSLEVCTFTVEKSYAQKRWLLQNITQLKLFMGLANLLAPFLYLRVQYA